MNPYKDLFGVKFELWWEGKFYADCYVAFIEPGKGYTIKEIESGIEHCCYLQKDGKPTVATSHPKEDQEWLNDKIETFAKEVRATGKYDAGIIYHQDADNGIIAGVGKICPSTIGG